MPQIPGSNFVVHATRPDSTQVAWGPFASANTAIEVGQVAVQNGEAATFYITYTTPTGGTGMWEQV